MTRDVVMREGEVAASGRQPEITPALLASLASHLERFAVELEPQERSALTVLLGAGEYSPRRLVAATPAETLLDAAERDIVDRLRAEPSPEISDFHPSLTVIMKATRLCNLRCTYCHSWSGDPGKKMSFEVMARAIRDGLRAPSVRVANFVWHGGEVTLLPLSFYRKAVWLQEQFRRPGQIVSNTVQTNGTRLNHEWLTFLRLYEFKIGVSLDGPPELHDRRRRDIAGRATSQRVQKSLADIRAEGLDYGVLLVVDEEVVKLGPLRILEYFLEIGVEHVCLINVIPVNDPTKASREDDFLRWDRFVEFLRGLFQEWWPRYADRISFREISDLIGKVQGRKAATCLFAGKCMGQYLTIEPAGEVAACDKYVGDESFRFGNILERDLSAMSFSQSTAKARAETANAVAFAKGCEWFDVCQGGCPHDRYLRQRHARPQDESCCGLAPLLRDIAAALKSGSKEASGKVHP